MKILLMGGQGQVGFELQRSLAVLGDLAVAGRARCDLTDADAIRALMRAERPGIVVNAAAYTAVDRAESEPDQAMRVNGSAPGLLAREAEEIGALLVHYSTDYVFDGSKPGSYAEHDAVAPCNVYGCSKLAGEAEIQAAGDRHLILRTSWVYGAHGANFLKTMLRLMGERDVLNVVADQTGAPTGAALIADVTAHLLAQYLGANGAGYPYGLYHLAAGGETTWHGYARLIAQEALDAGLPLRAKPDTVRPIATSDYPLPARRPANSRLDTGKLQSAFGLRLPSWEDGVRRTVRLLAEIAR
jgi:dTDP-4-dehydrorhamnose reductase